MVTRITINNFKKIETISFDLNSPLILIGPNNSGKTSILQAITLWEAGLKKWISQKGNKSSTSSGGKRQGVSINRKDLISLPIPSAKLLWHNLVTHSVNRSNGKPDTKNIFIQITIEWNDKGKDWMCGFEFYYANEESFYCRPIKADDIDGNNMKLALPAFNARVAYLQPMSGLASSEDRLTPGSIDRKIGEGKTADVIRNIAYQLLNPDRQIDYISEKGINERWDSIVRTMKSKFGIQIQRPEYNADNGLLTMNYIENDIEYDLSNSGRGFQQTLLLMFFLYSNQGKIILMDEPDAHLEVLRQKEIYHLISDLTRKLGSQLILATHSEIVLKEAASKNDDIIAILENTAVKLNDQRVIRDFKKSLTDFGWDKYYLAKLKKHCIYVEGSTDIDNLEAFATLLNHPIQGLLHEANVDPIEGNIPGEAFSRFQAMKFIEPSLKGICLFDRLNRTSIEDEPMTVMCWKKREIENYFTTKEVLIRWASSKADTLFSSNYADIIQSCIQDLTPPIYLNDITNPWWSDTKLGDWAEGIFREFSKRTNQALVMRKSNFHELIKFLKHDEVSPEIVEKLDTLYEIVRPN
jgi:ABC-type cobalamin/Fe3+-siderophores transport system ATPase subunit